MPADNTQHPQSAFASFGNNTLHSHGTEVTSNRSFAYFRSSPDRSGCGECLMQSNGFPSTPYSSRGLMSFGQPDPPASRLMSFGQPDPPASGLTSFGQPNPPTTGLLSFGQANSSAARMECDSIEENVANCVTVSNDEATGSNHLVNTRNILANSQQCKLEHSYSIKSSPRPAPSPVVPLRISPKMTKMKNRQARKAYYHQRHHPSPSCTSDSDYSATEVKYKSRFSTTGVSGKGAVVRDSKMSLSSSSPSPSAGCVGGSLCSNVSRTHFKPIAVPTSSHSFPLQNPGILSSCFLDTKVTGASASPTTPTGSPATRISSSASSGSRKRRAGETSQDCRISGNSSTSEVITGVGSVRLGGRVSTGSISPVVSELAYPQQPSKRSRNEEDDDVIFVSMTPGRGVQKPKAPSPAKALTSHSNVSSVITIESSENTYQRKTQQKISSRPLMSFGAPTFGTSVNPMLLLQQYANTSFGEHAPPLSASSFVQPQPANEGGSSKGYNLRSSGQQKQGAKKVPNYAVTKDGWPDYSASANDQQMHRKKNAGRQEPAIPCPGEKTLGAPHNTSTASTYPSSASNVPSTISSVPSSISRESSVTSQRPKFEEATREILEDPHRRGGSSISFSKLYDIKGKLGVGGGGVVYAGTRRSDNAEVAIKRVPKDKVKRWGKLDNRVVPIEFELLYKASRSGSKEVIKMYDWFERRSSYILVMERPQPVIDLFDYLNQYGPMPLASAKKIFRQMVKAVRHCHANGVIHRDIKDENVLLNLHTMQAKLIDFGCGTFLRTEPFTEFAGTPEFYPPEWFTEHRYKGESVDAWSLGVLLYTMLEAEVPFQKEPDIVRCELRHKKLCSDADKNVRDLIAGMLQKNPNDRLSLEQVLLHSWFLEDMSTDFLIHDLMHPDKEYEAGDAFASNTSPAFARPVSNNPSTSSAFSRPSSKNATDSNISNCDSTVDFVEPAGLKDHQKPYRPSPISPTPSASEVIVIS